MIEIGGKPILWHIMKIYSAYGINDFVICAGYKQNVIKEYFMNYYLLNSDVTFDLSDNSVQLLENHSENWKVTIVDTGLSTMTDVYDYGTSKVVGREQEHIKLELVDSKSSNIVNGIAFGQSASARYIKSKRSFDIAYTIEDNVFKRNMVQLQIEDIRVAEED